MREMTEVAAKQAFASVFAGTDMRPFVVGRDFSSDGTAQLSLHIASAAGRYSLRRQVAAQFDKAGIDHKFRVVRHKSRDLEKARSLEQFVAPFGHDEIAYDPTGAIARAIRLVGLAQALRESLAEKLRGVYWNSRQRSVHLVLDHANFVTDGKVRVADLAATEHAVLLALKAHWGDVDNGLLPSLRLGFELPDMPLVPVDAASYFSSRSLLNWLRSTRFVPVFGAMLGLGVAGTASAADLLPESSTVIPYVAESEGMPAVSAPNGKLSAFGGVTDSEGFNADGAGGVTGSYSVPLGYSYGAQFDGLAGVVDDDFTGGIGVHLFWRDPSKGLLGLTGSYTGVDLNNSVGGYTDMTRIGSEGELYLDQLTLAAQAGVQFGKNIDDGLYGRADLKWYASQDLALKAGAEYNDQIKGLGRVGLEFQPGYAGIPGLTLFADAAAGDDDYYKIFSGLRIYFGAQKSLIDRHRRDDPDNNLADNSSMLGTAKEVPVEAYIAPPS